MRELNFSLSRRLRLSLRLSLRVGVSVLNIRFSFAPHVHISGATPEAEYETGHLQRLGVTIALSVSWRLPRSGT